MTDQNTPDPLETPAQKALRLKKEAEARKKDNAAIRSVDRGDASMKAGRSKPWMRRY